MKQLIEKDLFVIAGGAQEFIVKQKISVDGIAPACVNTLASLSAEVFSTLSEEEMLTKLLSGGCKFQELELISDRLDEVAPISVEKL